MAMEFEIKDAYAWTIDLKAQDTPNALTFWTD
jgi:hypothetical protein